VHVGRAVPVVAVAGQRDARHARRHHTLEQRHVVLLEGIDFVAAARRLGHHGVSRILVGFKAGQRIGEESDFHELALERESIDFSRVRPFSPAPRIEMLYQC